MSKVHKILEQSSQRTERYNSGVAAKIGPASCQRYGFTRGR